MPTLKQLEANKKVDEIIQDLPGEYFVYLAPGWRLDGHGNGVSEAHSFGADSLAEISSTLKDFVVDCSCSECFGKHLEAL